jgi:hypothetical protein
MAIRYRARSPRHSIQVPSNDGMVSPGRPRSSDHGQFSLIKPKLVSDDEAARETSGYRVSTFLQAMLVYLDRPGKPNLEEDAEKRRRNHDAHARACGGKRSFPSTELGDMTSSGGGDLNRVHAEGQLLSTKEEPTCMLADIKWWLSDGVWSAVDMPGLERPKKHDAEAEIEQRAIQLRKTWNRGAAIPVVPMIVEQKCPRDEAFESGWFTAGEQHQNSVLIHWSQYPSACPWQ